MKFALALAAGLLLAPLAGRADDTPLVMTHEGRLLDASDQPVDASAMEMKFEFYAEKFADAGQTPLWSADCSVTVTHGNYAVVLGGDCGTALTTAALPFGAARYLQVSIDGVALEPRLLVGLVPGAAVAGNALAVGGLTPDELWKKSDAVDAATLGGKSLDDLTETFDARYVQSQPGGAVNIAGDVTALSLAGDGSKLTNLDAGQLATGTLNDAQLAGTYSGALSLTNEANAIAGSFTGDGSKLTNLDAGQLATGTIPDARLAGTYSGALSLSNEGNAIAGTFTGNGSKLTNLDAGQLATGTLNDARLAGTYSGALSLTNEANTIAGTFTGDGSKLTGLDAGQLATGTLGDARLAGTYSGDLTFSGNVAFTGTARLPVVTSLPTSLPAAGALVLDSTDKVVYVSTGSVWIPVGGGTNDGTSSQHAAQDCVAVLHAGQTANGIYWVKPAGIPVQAYCDLRTPDQNGEAGWMLVASFSNYDWYDRGSTNSTLGNSPANAWSSSFGNVLVSEFRVQAAPSLDSGGTASTFDWYYRLNTALLWKEWWAQGPGLNQQYHCSDQSFTPYNGAYNLRFQEDYPNNVCNEVSDTLTWPDFWSGLTNPGVSLNVNGASDGTLGVTNQTIGGQDHSDNNAVVGMDDGVLMMATAADGNTFTLGNAANTSNTTNLWFWVK